MPLYGGPGTSDEIAAWARAIVDAVRAAGATQPISLGDGAWGVEVTGSDNGYSLRTLAPLVDFVGPHVYPMEDDEVRQLLTAAFVCELASGFDRPVVLEEFGVSSDFAADEHAADYYRLVLHSTLLAGARGWLAWNNCDYDDLRDQDPYRHHVFEMHFGLTDRAGRPKPQLYEIERFAELVSGLADRGWKPVAGEVALVVPEHFERELPFTEPALRRDIRDNLLQAYIAAREADLPVALVRERDGLPGNARLYLAPSAKLLTAPGLDRLRALAESGATVYLSYFAGSTARQRGPWLTWLDEIFGVRHALRYGLVDPIEEDEVTFQFVEPLGEIEAGATLTFAVAGEASARVPPCRTDRRRRRRCRRARAPGSPAPRARPRLHVPLHLSARAHGRPHAAGEPGEHVAALLGAGDRGRRAPAGTGRRPASDHGAHSQRRRAHGALLELLERPDRSRADPRGRCRAACRRRRARVARAVRRRSFPLRRGGRLDGPTLWDRGRSGARSARREGCLDVNRGPVQRRPTGANGVLPQLGSVDGPMERSAQTGHIRGIDRQRWGGLGIERRSNDMGSRRRRQSVIVGLVAALATAAFLTAGAGANRISPSAKQSATAGYPRADTLITSGTQWGNIAGTNPYVGNYAAGMVGLVNETLLRFDPIKGKYINWLATVGDVHGTEAVHGRRPIRRQVGGRQALQGQRRRLQPQPRTLQHVAVEQPLPQREVDRGAREHRRHQLQGRRRTTCSGRTRCGTSR